MMSSGASGPTLGGCASTSLTLDTQWSPGPSFSSWASWSSPPPTLSSLAPPPIALTMWWSNSPSPLPLASPTFATLLSSTAMASVAFSSSIRYTFFLNLNCRCHYINALL
ncbi:hypothetical protein B296_00021348 [Ensete ventricosum]|uniref:Uncharacterized protein n=1 Tax=Ensete ventricosum TaxID=4639 RepID=A0A426Y5P5_ENSVE|nr:hypothetical protein B296_00021348 [Ensete ventricosum]